MPILQLVAQIPNLSGLPADRVENVVNLGFADNATVPEIASAIAAFADFYDTAGGVAQTTAIGAYMSEVLSRAANACTINAYETSDLSGETPFGSPVGTGTFTLPAATNANQFPEEVAVVLSMHGDLTDVPQTEVNPTPPPAIIRPAARRRGRIYIGPLGTSSGTDGAASIRPSNTFLGDLGKAFAFFCNEILLETTGNVCVWSKTEGAWYAVVGGFADNAWDTQRRRGLDPTTRFTWDV